MTDKKIPPLRIVLSGGGIRCVAHSGALKKLEEDGMLTAVKEYVGVSAGALIAFCIAIGYKIAQLKSLCHNFDFSTIRSLEPEELFSFFDKYGMDSGAKLQRLLESLLKHRGLPASLTYKQLREHIPGAPILRVFATDLCAVLPREFSEKKTPNISLVTSLMASMCIPVYFVPVKDPETGHLLVDGGVLHNFPFAFLTTDEQESALGITFSEDHVKVKKIGSVYQYFQQIYAGFYLPRTLDVWNKHRDKIIIIPCGDYPLWDFEASTEAKERLIQLGYDASMVFLKNSIRPQITRRYSVS
jgi:NTE family protein